MNGVNGRDGMATRLSVGPEEEVSLSQPGGGLRTVFFWMPDGDFNILEKWIRLGSVYLPKESGSLS